MKKIIFAAIAASTVATPALAANWQGKTYGQDAWGIYQVSADVESFCKFGTQNAGSAGTNGYADTGYLGQAHEADGRFILDIQDDDDNTVQAADAQYDIGYAVCNSPFQMQLASDNGGLKSDRTTSDNAFIENVPYRINFRFDGKVASSRSDDLTGWTNVTYVNEARAGAARVRVAVAARDKLLLEGTYSDRLQARLSPVL
jgi:opacity protein-like surface antigen